MKTLWLAALLGGFPPAAPQDEPAASAALEAWHVDPSGWLFITRASVAGTATRIDEGDEFRLDRGFVPMLKARASFSANDAAGFRYVPIELSGESTAPEDFIFHGTTYGAGRRVDSRLLLTVYDLDYRRRFRLDDRLTLTARLGLEAWRFSARLRTEDALPPISQRRSFSSLYWLGGADLDADLSRGFGARLSLLGGINEHDKHFFEVDAGAAYRPIPSISLSAGLRLHRLRFDHVTNEADLSFAGPYAGIEISF